jgi:hypothetical protein
MSLLFATGGTSAHTHSLRFRSLVDDNNNKVKLSRCCGNITSTRSKEAKVKKKGKNKEKREEPEKW